MNQNAYLCSFALLLAAACSTSGSPAPSAKRTADSPAGPEVLANLPANPDAPLPLSESVTKGVLPNGLTYMILDNPTPENRAEFWLAVDAGSIHEQPDQLGLAHFVEHMAFNGTRSFEKNQLLATLQGMGASFGPHINAETTFDRTVYKLQIPTDDDKSVDLAMKVLAEWASGITFLPEDVDAERGVVLSEKRDSLGPQMRMLEHLSGEIFAGTPYADRLPIGKPEVLQSAPAETLERFYRDWYRPEHMAVVAVGDFDREKVETALHRHFDALEGKGEPPTRPSPPRVIRSKPLVLSFRDKELPVSAVIVGRLRPAAKHTSRSDFRRDYIEQLAISMINHRLEEARQEGRADYVSAGGGAMPLVRAFDAVGFAAAVKPDQMRAGLDDLLGELERARRHGFVASELKRAHAELIASLESSAAEAAARREPSRALVEELTRHFLTGEAAPGRDLELAMAQHFASTVKAEEAQAVIEQLLGADDVIVLSVGPEDAPALSSGQALAALAELPAQQLAAYSDQIADQPLMAVPPTPGSIVSERRLPQVGAHEWTLSNGARLVVKPTDFQADQILFLADSAGGHSLSTVDTLAATRAADAVVASGGLGPFDATGLEKALAGRRASVRPYINSHREGIEASSGKADLETMMQLVHLSFTSPRADQAAFVRWREAELQTARLTNNLPEARFRRRMEQLRVNRDPRQQPWTEAQITQIDLDRSIALYNQRLADASDFRFFLVGSFELSEIRPLVERYLASLPDLDRQETFQVHDWPTHTKARRLVVSDGTADRTQLAITFRKRIDPDTAIEQRAAWVLFGWALRLQLLDLFREKLASTYSVTVATDLAEAAHFAVLDIGLQCEPHRAAELERRLLAEVRRTIQHGPSAEYLERARTGLIKQVETELQSNAFWRQVLADSYLLGRDVEDIPRIPAILRDLDPTTVRVAAGRMIDSDRPLVGVLIPENTSSKKSKRP